MYVAATVVKTKLVDKVPQTIIVCSFILISKRSKNRTVATDKKNNDIKPIKAGGETTPLM